MASLHNLVWLIGNVVFSAVMTFWAVVHPGIGEGNGSAKMVIEKSPSILSCSQLSNHQSIRVVRVFLASALVPAVVVASEVKPFRKVIPDGDSIFVITEKGGETVPYEKLTAAQRAEFGMTPESVAKIRADRKKREEAVRIAELRAKLDDSYEKMRSSFPVIGYQIISDLKDGAIVEVTKGGRNASGEEVYAARSYGPTGILERTGDIIFISNLHGADGDKGAMWVINTESYYKYTSANGALRTIKRAIPLPGPDDTEGWRRVISQTSSK